MPDERLLLAVVLTITGVALAIAYVRQEFGAYQTHRDPRALRGFVASLTVLAMACAIIGRSPTLREFFYDQWAPLFSLLTTAGLSGGLVGLVYLLMADRLVRRLHRQDR